jgi:hypothetical protein
MSRTYVTTKKLCELERSLTPREHLVLTTLARVRMARSEQLERLHFGDVTRRQARQVLAQMVARRLLLRLPRTVGGARAGSGGFVYALDVAGQRLATAQERRVQRPWNVGTPFLAHSLAVTEVFVRLVEAEHLGQLTLTNFAGEPACWRSFSGPVGRAVLKPDAYLMIGLGHYEDRWFIEVDRGTESAPTIARKCDTYRRYWQSGKEQARSGIFPRVLWLVPDKRRQAALVEVLGRQPAEAWPLFTVALFDDGVGRIAQGAAV